jgi:hypothetical protein
VRASPDAQEQETGASNNGLARFFAFTAASVFAFHPMATLAAPINAAEFVGTLCIFYWRIGLTNIQTKRNESLSHWSLLRILNLSLRSSAPFASSSVQIAGAAKSLDMSMPSYDTISAAKISADDFASLSITPVKEQRSPAKSKSRSKSEPASESGFALPAFLPSMNKKGPAQAAADTVEKKVAVADKVEKKAAVPKISTPTYDF